MFQKICCKTICAILLLTCLSRSAHSKASTTTANKGNSDADTVASMDMDTDSSEYNGHLSRTTIMKVQQCERDSETMVLCMRCAKETKSEFIYPMCCNNDEDIKIWCHKYVFYGQDSESEFNL